MSQLTDEQWEQRIAQAKQWLRCLGQEQRPAPVKQQLLAATLDVESTGQGSGRAQAGFLLLNGRCL